MTPDVTTLPVNSIQLQIDGVNTMLRENPKTLDSTQYLHTSGSQDVLELSLEGKIVAEWLMRLINDQKDYFAQKAFSESFRNGRNDTELQSKLRYLSEVSETMLEKVRKGKLDKDSLQVNLSITMNEG